MALLQHDDMYAWPTDLIPLGDLDNIHDKGLVKYGTLETLIRLIHFIVLFRPLALFSHSSYFYTSCYFTFLVIKSDLVGWEIIALS